MRLIRATISFFVALIIASCMTFEMPTTIKISPTALPGRTVTVMTSPTPLTSQIALTPLPTLTDNEAKKMVQKLLEDNSGCQLPCWWGIVPGNTNWMEARHFLETFTYIVNEFGSADLPSGTVSIKVPLPAPYSNVTYMSHDYIIRNGIVDAIRIYNYNLAPNYYLPKFLETNGQPSEIWMRTFSQEEIGQQNFAFSLFYQDRGILVEYSTATPIENVAVDGKLRNCLRGADSPFIYLWSPEQNKMSFQDAKRKFLDTINLPEPRPLLEATGMDVKTFYETFKNPNTDACIETPKDLWP